jgi:hypothetical protein
MHTLKQSVLPNEIYRLQLRNQELEDIEEATSDELIVTDGEGRILYVSGDVEDLYNIPKTDLIGKSVSFSMKSASCRHRCRPSCWILCRTADSPELAVCGNACVSAARKDSSCLDTCLSTFAFPTGCPRIHQSPVRRKQMTPRD